MYNGFNNMHAYLTTFYRETNDRGADFSEKVGRWCMGWLSLGFGKTVKISYQKTLSIFEEEKIAAWKRISAAVSAIFLFPISLLLAGIGCIGLACSESFAMMYIDYRDTLCKADDNPTIVSCKARDKLEDDSPITEPHEKTFPQSKPNIKNKSNQLNFPTEIPLGCDIRGTEWMAPTQLEKYAKDCIQRRNLNIHFSLLSYIGAVTSTIEAFFKRIPVLPEAYVFFPSISDNHFTLVYACRKTRIIEYYDSKKNYGNHNKVIADLKKLAKEFDKNDPGEKPYEVVAKITKSLQPDSYQCGPWALYFLKKRLKNPEVDFNELDVKKAQGMIARFRLKVMQRLIELN